MYPSLKTAAKLAKSFSRIPVYRELNLSQIGLLALVKSLENESGLVFLESAKENKKWSRFSFLGFNPRKTVSFRPPFIIESTDDGERRIEEDIFSYLKTETARYTSPVFRRFGDFTGGFVGYFGFDLVNHTGILRRPVRKCGETPVALLAMIDDFIVYDNVKERFHIAACIYPGPGRAIDSLYDDAQARLDRMEEKILALVERTSIPFLPSRPAEAAVEFDETREVFIGKVNAVKELIASGEAIQVVLSLRARIDDRIDPYRFYLKLRSLNPSPYMFYLKLDDLVIAGSSPEIHVKAEGNLVSLKPIAGTAPRSPVRSENRVRRQALLDDPKERAEHLMLVDLARNDLGRIALPGSVAVEQFMVPEDYSHVIHLVSLVTCKTGNGTPAADVLRETFPAGTVSGAPKVRAIEIIDEMEDSARGIYAGAVGYIGFNGIMDTCITIRTAVFSPHGNYIRAGAGIVYDSVPEKEYEEIRNKLAALTESLRYAVKKEAALCS